MKSSRSRLVLVIEDNPVVSTILRKYTERDPACELTVSIAQDGLAGFREACLRPPDLILLDLMMPNYDGRAFLDLYKAQPKLHAIPVIIYSAAGEERIEAVLRDYPLVKSALQKPVTPSHLVRVLREHLPKA